MNEKRTRKHQKLKNLPHKWIISDTHFGHKNILKSRPFDTLEQMHQRIILNWNRVVGKNDIVYILGDFSFYNKTKTKEIVDQLNGKLILITGNHDKKARWYYDLGFHQVAHQMLLLDFGRYITLSHKPIDIRQIRDINLHGHIHNNLKHKLGIHYYNVNLEFSNYTPTNYDELVENLPLLRGLKKKRSNQKYLNKINKRES